MELVITPYEGVGPIKFGMSTEEVRAVLNAPWRPLKMIAKGELPADNFYELDILVYYRQPGVCEAIEIFELSNLTFRGWSLIDQPYRELRQWFESMDSDIFINNTGLDSPSLGISLDAPAFSDVEGPDESVEAVLVFDQAYWDKLDALHKGPATIEWGFQCRSTTLICLGGSRKSVT